MYPKLGQAEIYSQLCQKIDPKSSVGDIFWGRRTYYFMDKYLMDKYYYWMCLLP